MTHDADDAGFDLPRRYYAAAAILIGVFMSALDSSIVNIALPTIASDLDVSAAAVIWVANGYQAVSYTHLDVYKRQRLQGFGHVRGYGGLDGARFRIIGNDAQPMSQFAFLETMQCHA